MSKKIVHTPLSAAEAIRTLCESGKLGKKIAKTEADYWEERAEAAALPPSQRPVQGSFLNAYVASSLVTEQCPKNTPQNEIRIAIEQVFPELFADYWEKVMANKVSS